MLALVFSRHFCECCLTRSGGFLLTLMFSRYFCECCRSSPFCGVNSPLGIALQEIKNELHIHRLKFIITYQTFYIEMNSYIFRMYLS